MLKEREKESSNEAKSLRREKTVINVPTRREQRLGVNKRSVFTHVLEKGSSLTKAEHRALAY